jgi:hypothetical protein
MLLTPNLAPARNPTATGDRLLGSALERCRTDGLAHTRRRPNGADTGAEAVGHPAEGRP